MGRQAARVEPEGDLEMCTRTPSSHQPVEPGDGKEDDPRDQDLHKASKKTLMAIIKNTRLYRERMTFSVFLYYLDVFSDLLAASSILDASPAGFGIIVGVIALRVTTQAVAAFMRAKPSARMLPTLLGLLDLQIFADFWAGDAELLSLEDSKEFESLAESVPMTIFQSTFYFFVLKISPESFDSSASLIISFCISLVSTVVSLSGLTNAFLQTALGAKDTTGAYIFSVLWSLTDVVLRCSVFALCTNMLVVNAGLFSSLKADIAYILALLVLLLGFVVISFITTMLSRDCLGIRSKSIWHVLAASAANVVSPYTLFFGTPYFIKTLVEAFFLFLAGMAWASSKLDGESTVSLRNGFAFTMTTIAAFLLRFILCLTMGALSRSGETAPTAASTPAAASRQQDSVADTSGGEGRVKEKPWLGLCTRRVLFLVLLLSGMAALLYINQLKSSLSTLDCDSPSSFQQLSYFGVETVDSISGFCPEALVLESITGNWDASIGSLTSVSFGRVASIGGNLDLYNNDIALIDFANLTRVGGYLSLNSNELTSVDFGQLRSIGGDLLAAFNKLTSIDFGALTSVGGDLDLSYNLLATVSLGAIEFIGGELDLNQMDDVTSFSFGAATRIGSISGLSAFNLLSIDFGAMRADDFVELASGTAVQVTYGAITSIRGDLGASSRLTSLDFRSIASIGGNLDIRSNQLASLNFGAMTRVDGDLVLSSDVLSSIHFGGITRIGGNLELEFLKELTSISFGQLASVGGKISLIYNKLASLNVGAITRIGGNLDITAPELMSVDFGAVQSVGGNLYLSADNVVSVDLNQITRVDGYLGLFCDGLATIDFGAITRVGGNLFVSDNQLTSINFQNLITVQGDVYVDCPHLSTCQQRFASQCTC